MPEVRLLVTICLGALFLIAAATKIASPTRFRSAVLGYQILPRMLVRPIAWSLPGVEVLVGITLLTGWAVRAALVAAATMLTGFCAAMILVMRKGHHPDCGCGIGGNRPIGVGLVTRNLILATLAALVSGRPTAGLRDVFAGSGDYGAGNGIAALLTLALIGVGTRLVIEGRHALRAVMGSAS